VKYSGGKDLMLRIHGMDAFWKSYLSSRPVSRFVDVCCGGGSISTYIGRTRPDLELVSNDAHAAVVACLRAVAQEGWDPPTEVSEDEYRALRVQGNAGEVSPLLGFVGFACSYSARYFAHYAKDHRNVNFADRARRGLRRDAPHLAHAQFHNLDYAALPDVIGVRDDDVWYIDKPYAGTSPYKGTTRFDETRFWTWAEELSTRASVLVSEYAAPTPWRKRWSATRKLKQRGGSTHMTRRDITLSKEDCVFSLD